MLSGLPVPGPPCPLRKELPPESESEERAARLMLWWEPKLDEEGDDIVSLSLMSAGSRVPGEESLGEIPAVCGDPPLQDVRVKEGMRPPANREGRTCGLSDADDLKGLFQLR